MARYRSFDAARGARTGVAIDLTVEPKLDDVRLRRAGLKAVMSGLEIALASPVANREDWVRNVRDALDDLKEVWTRHIVETEAPGAFLDELVNEAPRLATPASRLRREHNEILGVIHREESALAAGPGLDEYDDWSARKRSELTTLLVALARHRQRGADLVYEAYDVDIGGGY
jgi:hypothetical protein